MFLIRDDKAHPAPLYYISQTDWATTPHAAMRQAGGFVMRDHALRMVEDLPSIFGRDISRYSIVEAE
jgi:hypothetical protein